MLRLRRVLGVLIIVGMARVDALSVDDFVPSFLTADHRAEVAATNPDVAFSVPEATRKRTASNSTAWYCNRMNSGGCTKPNSSQDLAAAESAVQAAPAKPTQISQGGNDQYFNRNNINFDQNAVNNFNLTNSNQTALQIYSPQLNYTTEQQVKNSLSVPIQANKNTSVNVGQQQIEFNIKY